VLAPSRAEHDQGISGTWESAGGDPNGVAPKPTQNVARLVRGKAIGEASRKPVPG
jgi:hypothetical protein